MLVRSFSRNVWYFLEFSVGEIAPRGRFYALWRRFCDLPDLGDDFSFQGAISASLNILKLGIDSKNKNYICNFPTKLSDAHRLHSYPRLRTVLLVGAKHCCS